MFSGVMARAVPPGGAPSAPVEAWAAAPPVAPVNVDPTVHQQPAAPATNVVPLPGPAAAAPSQDKDVLASIAIETAKRLGSQINQAFELLAQYGVAKVSELSVPQLEEFIKRVDAMVTAQAAT
jgi:hypothetical protein